MDLYKSGQNLNKHKGFTLVEILLAIVIVGIIAGLVLPAVITRYQEKSFELAYKRETQTIQDLVDGLPVTEHAGTFANTIMHINSDPGESGYDESSGKFLKKYMRVSKYCETQKQAVLQKNI